MFYVFKQAKEKPHFIKTFTGNTRDLPYIWANVLTAAKNSLSRKEAGEVTLTLPLVSLATGSEVPFSLRELKAPGAKQEAPLEIYTW